MRIEQKTLKDIIDEMCCEMNFKNPKKEKEFKDKIMSALERRVALAEQREGLSPTLNKRDYNKVNNKHKKTCMELRDLLGRTLTMQERVALEWGATIDGTIENKMDTLLRACYAEKKPKKQSTPFVPKVKVDPAKAVAASKDTPEPNRTNENSRTQ